MRPSDDTPLDPTAERVADFVSAQVGPSPRRRSRAKENSSGDLRASVRSGVTEADHGRRDNRVPRSSLSGWLGSRFRDRAPTAAALSYRVDNQDPPSGGYILASQTADSLLGVFGWVEGQDGGADTWARRRGERSWRQVRARRRQGLGRHRSSSSCAVDLRGGSVPRERTWDVVHRRLEPRRGRVRRPSCQRRRSPSRARSRGRRFRCAPGSRSG